MSTAEIIKAGFIKAIGRLPILWIDEYRDTDYPDTHDYCDYASLYLDVAKIDLVDDYELRYVRHLFDAAIRQLSINPDLTRLSDSTSRKYSFGDTDDWWDAIKVERPHDGAFLQFEIGVHS